MVWVARQGSSTNLAVRACVGCGEAFLPYRHNQLRCVPSCGKNHSRDRDRRTAAENQRVRTVKRAGPTNFVAIDGEGVTDTDGTHRYLLLTVGSDSLDNGGAHLEVTEIFDFLWHCFTQAPEAAFVGFFLSYDWAQWLRTLPTERAGRLLSPEGIAARERKGPQREHISPLPVDYKDWQFDWIPAKRFRLRPEGNPPLDAPPKLVLTRRDKKTGEKYRRWKWLYICDVGSYYQTSFLKAINPAGALNPVCTQEEYAIISEGKARRQSAAFDPEMIRYNLLECEILSRLMAQLEEGVRGAGLKMSRKDWMGPGQVAQKWMNKINAPLGEAIREATPPELRLAAQSSYYGGWFEQFAHGPIEGTSYQYDINSAYPFVLSKLPCLLHGDWTHTKEREKGRRLQNLELDQMARNAVDSPGRSGASPAPALVRALVQGVHPVVGAMPHRLKSNRIIRPHATQGWFWLSELAASYLAGFISTVYLFETWAYQPCDCPHPFAAVADLYQERLKVGKNTISGKTYKLIYNSVYGKLAQSIGDPKYANPFYASLITSGCRQLCLEAIASHPGGARDLLMVATDSVTFRSPHTALDLDPARLGAWDSKSHENLSLFLPGLYWDDADRERVRKGDAPVFKSRGVPARDIAKQLDAIDAAWERFETAGWPTIDLPMSFQLVSPKTAWRRGKWELCGTVISLDNPETWAVDKHGNKKRPARTLNANPRDKRITSEPGPSRPYDRGTELVSVPYQGSFGEELRLLHDEEFGDHPDGLPGDLLGEMIMDH